MASSDLNWDHIIEMATRHRLRPLLYYNLNLICPDKVPENILKDLKNFYHENARKNLLLYGELIQILKVFEKIGIQSINYKGPVLAFQAYNNLGLRQFGDIDIFIDKKDVLKAKNILLNYGYDFYNEINIDESLYLKLDSEYRFINKNGVLVEINWNFEGLFLAFSGNPKSLFQNLETFNNNSFKFTIPNISNQLLMLAVHCSNHNWNRLSWICDISEFIENQNINWEEVFQKAEELGIKRILLINMYLSSSLFGSNLPDEVINQIKTDDSVKIISLQIKERFFNQKKLNIFGKFILNLKKRENLRYGLKDCYKSLTKPDYRIFEYLPLSEKLFPLYFILKPFIIIKKYGKSSI